jgi:hypothetical protein
LKILDISSIKHKETRQSGFTLRGNVPQGITVYLSNQSFKTFKTGPGMGAGAPSASVGLGSRPATIQAGGGTIGKREAILPRMYYIALIIYSNSSPAGTNR